MAGKHIRVLVVDDEPDILEFIEYNLKKENYKVSLAHNGREAIAMAKKELPHLILLDIMMPELDGIETCQQLRALPEFKNTVIAFLTARNEDYSQIAGFESGADDYINKPIKPKVLLSRIKALLRRVENIDATTAVNRLGDIEIDLEKYIVYKNGEEVNLPKKEFELINLLASKPGKVFRREEIMKKIWGDDVIVTDRTIDVHIRKLREKFGKAYFKTIKGIGYKLDL